MKHLPVASSNVASVGYENGVMEVRFRSGSLYRATGILVREFREFMDAESKGSHFATKLKNHPTVKWVKVP